ncbi:MAG TPA: anti-sigma factor antagonist [Ruminococcaceae bacterium]|nr:anti-sigma factor antagonist [Oscillospiraceae bacterium]
MTISKTENGKEVTVSVEGRIDSKTAPEFEKEVKDCFESYDSMVIDLAQVNYVSSAGLRILLTAHKAMSAKEGLKVRNVCKEVMAIFNVTGFSGVLDIK